MKLRNKRTGEIVELSDEEYDAYKVFTKLLDNADWVEYKSAEPLIKDEKTKQLFSKYLEEHQYERFMEAVRNFIGVPFLVVTDSTPRDGKDTFYWECDEVLKEEE